MSDGSRLVFEAKSIGIPGVHSLGQYYYTSAKPGLPPHRHKGCVEISLLVKGYQAFRVGGIIYHVKGGEQYISLPDEMHDSGDEPQDKGILYWLILDVVKCRDTFLFLAPEMASNLISELLQFPSRHFPAAPESNSALEKAFRSLQQIHAADECTGIFQTGSISKASVTNGKGPKPAKLPESFYLLEIATHLLEYIQQTIRASRANVRHLSAEIKNSLDFIAKNDEEWLNVADVAGHIHLSESHFKVLFREEVGLPPAEYMLRRKVDAAKTQLSKPGCNITELAYRLGFSSSQYFATVFKRFTNLTPSEFIHGHPPEFIHIHEQE